jgi:Na+/proline symporter
MAKKDRNIIEVAEKDEGNKKIGVDSKGKLIEVEETPREGAKPRRVLAVCLWLVGIFFEVIGILRLKDVINWLPSMSETTFLIVCLVIDCIVVIIGSLLWKRANHIDPASEKNKTKFWIQNNLGTIISVIAFLPIILFVLTDKEMDKKNKTIVSIVAIVLMLIAGITSYDFNPVSIEQLDKAEKEVLATENFDTHEDGEAVVYWDQHSKK